MNMKQLEYGTFKRMNFEETDEWRLKDEVILLADSSYNTIEAKHLEVQNGRYHQVYIEVEGQTHFSVRWAVTARPNTKMENDSPTQNFLPDVYASVSSSC